MKNASNEIKERTPISEQILDGTELGKLGWKSSYSINEGCEEILRMS